MVVLIIAVIITLLYLFLICPSLRKHPDSELCRNMLVAHRGLHDMRRGVPENSIASYKAAIAHGYAIEIDIHLTKDGRLAVFHDDTLRRVCGDSKKVEELTFDELQKYTLCGTSEKIPSLEEVIKTVNGRVPLVIEFKSISSDCKALCKAADSILSGYGGKYLIQSFNPMVVAWYRKNRPEICRGQLATNFSREPDKDLIKTLVGMLVLNVIARPDFISYEIKYTSLLRRRLCSAFGAINAGWTFRSNEEFKKYAKYYNIKIFENFEP